METSEETDMEITEKVLCYQQGHWSWTDLWRHANCLIEEFFEQAKVPDEYQVGFLNSFEPRLLNMIESFEYRGMPFGALLRRSLHLHLKTIYAEARKERIRFNYYSATTGDPAACALVSENCVTETRPATPQTPGTRSQSSGRKRFAELPVADRRLIICAFKNCLQLDDRLCRALSERYGLALSWILNCRDRLTETIRDRLEAHTALRDKLHRLRMDHCCPVGPENLRDMDRHFRRELRIIRLEQRLRGTCICPRHQDIALVLGIPKGSVDSSLFYVRLDGCAGD
jgi:hypothetical protein